MSHFPGNTCWVQDSNASGSLHVAFFLHQSGQFPPSIRLYISEEFFLYSLGGLELFEFLITFVIKLSWFHYFFLNFHIETRGRSDSFAPIFFFKSKFTFKLLEHVPFIDTENRVLLFTVAFKCVELIQVCFRDS